MQRLVVSIAAMLVFMGTSYAGGGTHWGYSGHEGPENWGKLDDSYSMCSTGKNQSPINISRLIKADLPPVQMIYGGNPTDIVNNGHTIMVDYEHGNALIIENKKF